MKKDLIEVVDRGTEVVNVFERAVEFVQVIESLVFELAEPITNYILYNSVGEDGFIIYNDGESSGRLVH